MQINQAFVFWFDQACTKLIDAKRKYPADCHETYFEANGENYRIRIERIPDDSSTRRKGEHANT